ncbi:tRNA preQ1(34) S-adenosylmethionine ribosyltransferase-isomerase QueA [Dongia sp. agr-C8]
MKTADFDFPLPPDRIAQHPAKPRDSARLLVVGAALEDRSVRELPGILRAGDLMIVNDTKVIPAQLEGRKGEARIEVTLIRRSAEDAREWDAFAKPGKKLKLGDVVTFGASHQSHPLPTSPEAGGGAQRDRPFPPPSSGEGWGGGAAALTATILEKKDSGEISLRFDCAETEVMAALHSIGSMPLPPYIRKLRAVSAEDDADYQTIFAAREGAVAAPTAGLHFTPALLAALEQRGVEQARVTLHVGAGTFLPVKVDDIAEHKMHAEWGEVSAATAAAFNRARAEGRRIVAVGTTSLRLLESALDTQGKLQPFARETDIFIHPGKTVRSADLLLTNFHLPKSTLFMLVCAFAGTEKMRAAYQHAIDSGYRFFSYGDACLLENAA